MSTIKLMRKLEVAYEEFKSKGEDGGLDGALSCALAIQDYFVERRPDWVEAGILNPINQIILTLRALKDGGTSAILTANLDKIDKKPRTLETLAYRGVVSALIDLIIDRQACSLDSACAYIVAKLRKRGFPLGRGSHGGGRCGRS